VCKCNWTSFIKKPTLLMIYYYLTCFVHFRSIISVWRHLCEFAMNKKNSEQQQIISTRKFHTIESKIQRNYNSPKRQFTNYSQNTWFPPRHIRTWGKARNRRIKSDGMRDTARHVSGDLSKGFILHPLHIRLGGDNPCYGGHLQFV